MSLFFGFRRTFRPTVIVTAVLVLSACSLTEPSINLPTLPATPTGSETSYDAEKRRARELQNTMQTQRRQVSTESHVYTVAAVLSGLGAAVASIYDASNDMIKGFVLGGAVATGTDKYLNPGDIVGAYDNGIEALNCVIGATDAFNAKSSPAAISAAMAPMAAPAAPALVAPGAVNTFSALAYDTTKAVESRASAFAVSSSLQNLETARVQTAAAQQAIQQGKPADEVLRDAVIGVISAMNKAIRERTRDKTALTPSTLLADIKTRNDAIEAAVKNLEQKAAVVDGQMAVQAILSSSGKVDANVAGAVASISGAAANLRDTASALTALAVPEDPFRTCMASE